MPMQNTGLVSQDYIYTHTQKKKKKHTGYIYMHVIHVHRTCYKHTQYVHVILHAFNIADLHPGLEFSFTKQAVSLNLVVYLWAFLILSVLYLEECTV